MAQNSPVYSETNNLKEPSVLWLYLAGFLWLMVPVVIVIALFARGILNSPFSGFQPDKYTSQQVVDAFKGAGLDVTDIRPYGTNLINIPFQYNDGFNFSILSAGSAAGGSIANIKTNEDMDKAKNWVTELGKQSSLFSFRIYQKDNILVTISSSVSDITAQRYESILANLK